MKLKDKVAVVTGGGSGIGAEICRQFHAAGAKVVICDINKENAEKHEPGCLALAADVSKLEELENVAAKTEKEFGRIDIWVNCAGISYIVPFLECSEETWDKTIAVNLKGTFNGCKAAIRHMLPKKSGNIINMSSQSGKTGNSHYAAYCASKFGVIGLTQSLAVEFAPYNIRVNALCPGVVFTPMWDSMTADYAAKRNMKPEEVKPYFESKIPLGRLCEINDVAKAALFLASDNSSYITGQSLNISGGSVMH
jgi:NAD(P)-dependent dehydrogenase (short-subunit alcohol dehydrogenase family)